MATAELTPPVTRTKTHVETVLVEPAKVFLTMSVDEAQLVREFALRVNSQEGDSAAGILDALRYLNLPTTYAITDDGSIHVSGKRPKEVI